jgi:hypothetical protein
MDKLLKHPTSEEDKECKWCKHRHLGVHGHTKGNQKMKYLFDTL